MLLLILLLIIVLCVICILLRNNTENFEYTYIIENIDNDIEIKKINN